MQGASLARAYSATVGLPDICGGVLLQSRELSKDGNYQQRRLTGLGRVPLVLP
jgi:hypothetical protein